MVRKLVAYRSWGHLNATVNNYDTVTVTIAILEELKLLPKMFQMRTMEEILFGFFYDQDLKPFERFIEKAFGLISVMQVRAAKEQGGHDLVSLSPIDEKLADELRAAFNEYVAADEAKAMDAR